MKTRKGQAAMEYITTYGWALVALVAVIGAIMATGAFNPSYLVSEECTFQPDLSCTGHLLYTEGDQTFLKYRINNGLGYDIVLERVNVTTTNGDIYEDFTVEDEDGESDILEQGTSIIVILKLDELKKSKGEIERLKVSVEYLSCAPEVNYECGDNEPVHVISGRIVARVEEKTT